MTNTRELFEADRSSRQSLNSNVGESYQSTIRALGAQIISPDSAVTFERIDFGGIYVPSGTYGGFTCPAGRNIISCAPGARFQMPVEILGTLVLVGAYLDCQENKAAITVAPGGRLILQSCQITKGNNLQKIAADTYIKVEVGGYASINGCIFHGTQTNTGALVYNMDALNPNRVAVVGAMNLTDIAAPYVSVSYSQDVP
tara:strand:- start:734 stop:1333 length:600 start_codon:yes stop_codon:yes gene_type:complete